MTTIQTPANGTTTSFNDIANAATPVSSGDAAYDAANGYDAISEINQLMVQLAELFKKLRNILQDYNVKQQELAFAKQKTSYDNKLVAIQDSFNASTDAAIGEIISGALGVAGSVASPLAKVGDIAMHATQVAGKLTEGIAKYGAAEDNKMAQTRHAEAEFQANSAENYTKGVADVSDKAREASRQLNNTIRELVELYNRLSSSVKLN